MKIVDIWKIMTPTEKYFVASNLSVSDHSSYLICSRLKINQYKRGATDTNSLLPTHTTITIKITKQTLNQSVSIMLSAMMERRIYNTVIKFSISISPNL